MPSYIRNHSFEDRQCCPFGFVAPGGTPWLDCATGWHQATPATSDYFNECGYSPVGFNLPPPDGDGAVGFYAMSADHYFEYMGTCLTYPLPAYPLLAGTTYTISLWISTAIANDSTGNLATIGTSITPGTSAAHLGKAEDGAHTTGDTGVMLLGVRAASPTDRSAGPTDGDYEPLGINAAGAVWTTPTPTTAGGLTTHYLTSAASTNSTNVKNAAGQVYLIRAVNTTSTLYYLRMYNASAAPTCSSATNFVETIPIPASASGAGIVIPQYMGQTYATGISYCLTGGGSSTDNTNAATGVYLTILYK